MKTQSFQNKLDVIINKLFLWAVPKRITPNMLSYLRLALIPPLIYLLWQGQIIWGLGVFFFAALTDAMDGTAARTRNQVTNLGKVLDPVADKALIATMLVFFGFDFLIVKIFLVFIALEIIAIVSSSLLSYKFGRPIGANIFGKVKMALQTLSVLIFITGIIVKNSTLVLAAEYILFVALFFALISGYEVLKRKWPKIAEALKA